MNPYRAVAMQSLGLALSLFVSVLFGTTLTFWLLLAGSSLFLFNNLIWMSIYFGMRLRLRRHERPLTAWRRRGDWLAVIEALLPPLTFAVCVAVWGTVGPFSDAFAASTVVTVTTALSLMLAAVTGSSTIDWFYIRGFRDGAARIPPCLSADDPRWAALTKTWLRHRLIAELGFVLFFVITGLALAIEGIQHDGFGSWVRTAVGAAITIASIVLKYSSSRLRIATVGIPGANRSVRFAVGETLAWRVNSNDVMRIRSERRIGIGKYRWHLRRVEQRGRKRPPLYPKMELGYVRDVALDVATVLEMDRNQSGRVKRAIEVPMDVLFHEGAEIHRSQTSWCRERKACLLLQERCELHGRPLPVPTQSTEPSNHA